MFGNGKNSSTSTIKNGLNGFVNTLNTGFNTGAQALEKTANTANNALSNLGSNAFKFANSTMNTLNSTAPTTTSGKSNTSNSISSYFGSLNVNKNKGNNKASNSTSNSASNTNASIFYVYNDSLGRSYTNIMNKIKVALGYDTPPPPQPTLDMNESSGIIEKILPVSNKEVFNVSSNDYTYYDAEPLCRALGAELATYDQVKDAWENGADWCNYGWVKGQVAVYPTQRETWEKLQGGPDEEKEACGMPGINGGYFDNPEMKFGVTCYGDKPAQSANDERILVKNGAIPRTTEMLKVDERVQDFKEQLGTIGLLPFNHKNWEQT